MNKLSSAVLSSVIALGLLSGCGDDDSDAQVGIVPPGAPTVLLPATGPSLRVGETVTFPVEVRAPSGIRNSGFLIVTQRQPNGNTSDSVFNPADFGCVTGDTFCRSDDFVFRVGANADAGNYQLTFVAVDTTNQTSVPSTLTIFAFR
ncbi:MAG: hypothetical protein HC921_12785 [Synechococcaceae cyanobacterium SM2_3_1]|nr:hypothetical protein [Synechococcaceae cyanobacterium SM2_3_1]